MRLLKAFITGIVALGIVVTLISLFFPSQVRISRAANIKATPELLLEQVGDLQQWRKWFPPLAKDSSGSMQISTPSAGKGAYLVSGKRKLSITEKNMGGVKTLLQMPGEEDMVIGVNVIPAPTGDSSIVQWYIDKTVKWYPWEKFASIFYDKMMGTDLEEGLAHMKTYLEKAANLYGFDIEEKRVTDTVIVAIKTIVPATVREQALPGMYAKLKAFIEKNGLSQVNPPMANFKDLGNGQVEVMAGLPVNKETAPAAGFSVKRMPKGKLLVIHYYGDYAAIDAAYRALNKYILDRHIEAVALPYEVYTDSLPTKGQVRLDIYYPVF
jgi:effector-binding domain-containing protein